MKNRAVFLNGSFCSSQEAMVSVFDRGFLFGDGLYDVLPCYNKHVLGLKSHLKRFDYNLSCIGIPNPYSEDEWRNLFAELVNKETDPCMSIYVQVSRGISFARKHAPELDLTPTVFVTTFAVTPPTVESLSRGYRVMTVADPRPRSSYLKSTSHLPNVMLAKEAKEGGYDEVIVIRDGFAIEGMSSNLFIVHNDTLYTPPNSPALVNGITRDIIMTLAKQQGIPCQEAPIRPSTLAQAQEIWLTGSTKEIVPVLQLNGAPVNTGKPGPIWQKIYTEYCAYRAAHLEPLVVQDEPCQQQI
jgi:D-alanine transaminase